MKFHWDKKYLFWGVTAFIVIACSMAFYDFMFSGNNIMTFVVKSLTIIRPITYGLVIAYLLNPIVSWIEHNLLYRFVLSKSKTEEEVHSKAKTVRFISVFLTLIIFIGIIYGLIVMIIPQLFTSISNIIVQFPNYVTNLETFITKLLKDNPDIEKIANDMISQYSGELNDWLNTKLIPQVNIIVKEVSVSLIGVIKVLWNLIIGIIVSIYLLNSKETFAGQCKKIIYAYMSESHANRFIEDVRFADKTFGGYIIAKLIDSLIIGILCFIGISIMNMPYPVLIAVIIGVTNIIPFFGPYIGAIPSILLILMVDPVKALTFTIFVLILQQIDGNFIGPKLLGDKTGLSSFWVIFSITVMGGYFGVLGMAIGVPVFAIIYAAIRRKVNQLLIAKNLTTDSSQYIHLKELKDHEMILSEAKSVPYKKTFEQTDKTQNNLK